VLTFKNKSKTKNKQTGKPFLLGRVGMGKQKQL